MTDSRGICIKLCTKRMAKCENALLDDSDSDDVDVPMDGSSTNHSTKLPRLRPIQSGELEYLKNEVERLVNVEKLDDALSTLSETLKRLCETESLSSSSSWATPEWLAIESAKLTEMQAQIRAMRGEYVIAARLAERAHRIAPCWSTALQTYGRALYNLGEVRMAQRAFSRAIHLDPSCEELWIQDLKSCEDLLKRSAPTITIDSPSDTNQQPVTSNSDEESARLRSLVATNYIIMRT